ncbi:hypothetical protein [Clostridiisalibacter paucivorans]|uniref:hypothetical protein n=1 Tax=Clostridiisalibacter paucivorans TaxID=408753 RepID=UPI00047B615A|nr:hypothetical protein [Clostridiisalibacter paucivorans]
MKNRYKVNKALLADTYEVKMNLIEDWNNHLNDRMRNMGYRPKPGGYNSLDYHKAMKKIIPAYPRRVHYSKEFSCPDECKSALSKIVSAIESGKNLLPYMSKQTIRPSKNDGLLNDWNIHHFHLNEQLEKNTIFIKRSDWLLLAFVNDEAVYCLNVYSHRKPYLWSHIKLIEIIYNNWPELIEKNKLEGIVGLTEKLDDKGYSMLRKANATTLVEIGENNVYGLIGGGYASDGSSTEAVRTSDYWYNYIRKIELYIRDDYQSFKRQMLPFDPFSMEKILQIKLLTLTEEELIFLEKQRNFIIKADYNSGNIRMCKLSSLLDEFLYTSQRRRLTD